jgi:hypothetical protein
MLDHTQGAAVSSPPTKRIGRHEGRPSLLVQRLIEVLDQIVGVFEADGQAQQTFG